MNKIWVFLCPHHLTSVHKVYLTVMRTDVLPWIYCISPPTQDIHVSSVNMETSQPQTPGGCKMYRFPKQTFNWLLLVCVHGCVSEHATPYLPFGWFILSLRMHGQAKTWVSHKLEHRCKGNTLEQERWANGRKGSGDERWPGCHRLLQGWRDVSLAVRRVKTRQSCVPQALFVPDDSQLMSYLGQSTLRIECVHRGEKRGGEEEGDKKEKKKSVIWLVIQQMLQICSRASSVHLGLSKHLSWAGEKDGGTKCSIVLKGFEFVSNCIWFKTPTYALTIHSVVCSLQTDMNHRERWLWCHFIR